MSWEDFIVVFWSLLTCTKWCLCLRLWGKGLSLLASQGRIFTAYLLRLEIFPVGKAKKFWTLTWTFPCWSKRTPWGAKHSRAVPGVPWGALLPHGVGWGDAMPWGWSREAELPCWAPGRTAAPAVLGVIASVHTRSCSMETAWQLEKKPFSLQYLFQFINLSRVKSNYWNIAQFFFLIFKILFKILFVFCFYVLIVARTWQLRNWKFHGIFPFPQYLLIPLWKENVWVV